MADDDWSCMVLFGVVTSLLKSRNVKLCVTVPSLSC